MPDIRERLMAEIVLRIVNDGPRILATNFYHTALARAGKFYLSINAGAFRLLVPKAHESALREMRTARKCVVSRGPYPDLHLPDAIEVLFDDGSQDPWSVHLSPQACDRMPLDTDTVQEWTLTVWRHVVGTRCQMALEFPAHYRRVRRLPDLRPWEGA